MGARRLAHDEARPAGALHAYLPEQNLGVFAGKIVYPALGPVDRTMIRFIMWMTKGPTDPTGTYEFTDWDKVEEFGRRVAEL